MTENLKNWAGNLTYSTDTIHYPQSIDDLQNIIKQAQAIRGLGSRHSFNHIADSQTAIVSTKHLNKVLEIDTDAKTVTMQGGITYGQLCPQLYDAGFALHNLASLPHISVVGACMTATHGSGVNNGNLATAVSALEIITANGETLTLTRDDDDFYGAVVSLGALGIVSKITLDIQPTFDVRQDVYLNLPFSQLEKNFNEIMSTAYSVSFFTDWQGDTVNQIWLKSLADTSFDFPETFFGATKATQAYNPVGDMPAENATEQMGKVGAWLNRLPHFKFEFTPSAGDELQTEYFVPREQAFAALSALKTIQDDIAPHLLISEVRTIAADNLWLSMSYQQDSVAFHFTWKPDWPAVQKVLPKMEAQLEPFGVRPHWGKLFTMPATKVQSRYEKLGDFQNLLKQHDPDGKFRNAFIDDYIFSE